MGEARGVLRALQQVEARCLQQQQLIKHMAKFIKGVREENLMPPCMRAEAKSLEERAQTAELQG